MSRVSNLIVTLAKKDIRIYLEEGKLKINAPDGALDEDLLLQLKTLKPEIIEFLSSEKESTLTEIPNTESAGSYALSSGQKRLWILSQMEGGNSAYNMPDLYEFEGVLNHAAFDHAWFALIERHEILRTVFKADDQGEIKQWILPLQKEHFRIIHHDFKDSDSSGIKELIQEGFTRPFDLAEGPLLRADLYRVQDTRWMFSFVMHHIVSDGWSMHILIEELLTLYNFYIQGIPHPLAPLRIQYKDYAAWQQNELAAGHFTKYKSYWLNQLSGDLPVLELPASQVRPLVKTYPGEETSGKINKDVLKKLKAFCQEQDCTLFMGLLATVNALLYRYTNQSDMIIGSPIAGREHPDLDEQIGFYVNTLALRTRFQGEDNFRSLIQNVRNVALAAYQNQAYPFDLLLDDLKLKRDMSRNALFDVMVALHNFEENGKTQKLGELNVRNNEDGFSTVSKFDLTFTFTEIEEELNINLVYNSDIYSAEFARGLEKHLEILISGCISSPDTPIQHIDFLYEEEKRKVLLAFNDTHADYPTDKTIVQVFEEQVRKTPQHIAVVFENIELTYTDLNERANQFANYLRENCKIERDDVIALLLERSEYTIITILGVLKSGAAYVSIDPEYPQARVDYMIENSGCKKLIDETDLAVFNELQKTYDTENLIPVNKPEDLAYVIYTSGSTGKPKGVMIEHRAMINYIQWFVDAYTIQDNERAVLLSSVSFDGVLTSLFGTLLSGGSLYVIPKYMLHAPLELANYLNTKGVTFLTITPPLLSVLVSNPESFNSLRSADCLQKILIGGEKLIPRDVQKLLESRRIEIINLYGPSETTVSSTSKRVTDANLPISIGTPISNTQIYVLDKHQQPVPVGVIGEICISGKGLARGYLNEEELTVTKFVPNPFRSGERMYRTGDLGKWLSDGNLDFINRADDQVKIRGYRIELAEIELALLEHALILSAVLITRADQAGNSMLIAYIVSKEKMSASDLRGHLGNRLPSYMIPAFFVQLDQIPLTTNGKVNRNLLPAPQDAGMQNDTEYVAPRNAIEEELITICKELFGKERIGVKEDFFILGGDSIKSIQVSARLKQKGYHLSIQDILSTPVLENLALRVRKNVRVAAQGIQEGIVPLGPVQQYFFENNPIETHHFNQSVVLRTRTSCSAAALEKALQHLMLHHDALRMSYTKTLEGWSQYNRGNEVQGILDVVELCSQSEYELYCEKLQAGFVLSEGPLFRAALFRGTDGDKLLLIAHHLIIDGVSWRIIFEDLSLLYSQYSKGDVPTLPLKTDSFLCWQKELALFANSARLRKEKAYWSSIESQEVPALRPDIPTGSNLVKDEATVLFSLDADLTLSLLTHCYRAYRSDTNDVLLAAFGTALHQTFGSEKVLIHLEGHGRENIGTEIDVSRTLGWFTTLFPVILKTNPDHNLIAGLIETKESLHRIPNKGIGYGVLRYLGGEAYSLNPEIIFNYLGDFGSGLSGENELPVFEFADDFKGQERSLQHQRDGLIDVSALIAEGVLTVSIAYSQQQFAADTMETLKQNYFQSLKELIGLLAEEEKTHLTPVDLSYKYLSTEQLNTLNTDLDVEDVYPLSPLQEGMYFYWLSNRMSPMYFEQMSYRLKARLNIALLEQSYNLLVARHGILRTYFTQEYGLESLQVVKKKVASCFQYAQFIGASPEFILELKEKDQSQGFDLHQGSQMRLTVLDLGEDIFELIWSSHHIIMDGWCTGILINEFFKIYDDLMKGRTPSLGTVYPYSGYINWLSSQELDSGLSYWKAYLSDYDTLHGFPKRNSNLSADFVAGENSLVLSAEKQQSIRKRCAELGVTENTFIQSIWGLLLSKYNSSSDVVFGSVVSGRPPNLLGIEEMIGLFINTIPVRVCVSENQTVKELLKKSQSLSIEGSEYHHTQLAEIQTAIGMGGSLFDHILVFENYPVQEMLVQHAAQRSDSEEMDVLSASATDQTNYDLTVIIVPEDGIRFIFKYNRNVYEENQICRIASQIEQLIDAALQNPDQKVQELNCLSEGERHILLNEFNGVHSTHPDQRTLVNLFEEQVLLSPNRTALVFEDKSFTYQQLNESSNQLAVYLKEHYQIKADDLIGVNLKRTEWMIIAMLGILKSGGAYVPIDPEYPKDRIEYIIADSTCKVLINEAELDLFKNESGKLAAENPLPLIKSENLAYVIYTSGTTGMPKGTLIEHRNVVSLLKPEKLLFDFNEEDVWTMFHSYCFDFSVWEIFGALCSGAKLVLVPSAIAKDPSKFVDLLIQNRVTVLNQTPASFYNIIKEEENRNEKKLQLRYVIFGGEALNPAMLDNWSKRYTSAQLINMYGITETTVHVTYKEIGKQEIEKGNSNIGKPIPSLSCFVLDEHQALLPIGIPGELYVGGAGLARGYLNRPELTGLRFIQSPFNPKERLYRSGDLVRYLPDGEMEYLGRIDDQVKIRGYRIELGEVENALLQHPLVLNAVVLAKTESQGETELIAYLVSDQTLDAADLKDHLSSLLPQYMLPSFYIQLDKIPLNANGKKDRKALLAKDTVLNLNKVVYSPPQDELEERIALCWSLALGREKELIGVEFNFFDIGGNSIRIVKLARAIRQELNKEISLAALFEYTTIRSFADYIRNDQTDHPVQEVEEVNQEELVADFEIFNIEEE